MTLTQTNAQVAGARDVERRTLAITVLAGGPGVERAVSLDSGRAVCAGLKHLGHNVALCDIAPTNLDALDRDVDFVFIALHGEFGEDGQVQAALDQRGLVYSGSGVEASRRAMDKAATKQVLEREGLPTPSYVVTQAGNVDRAVARMVAPCVVKPVSCGSSVDTTINHTPDAVRRAAEDVAARYGAALIERYIEGPELTVGILGSRTLPVCEIRTRRAFYDYAAKYEDDDTQYLFDLDLPDALIRRVEEIALRAHCALGCQVFSRVDIMIDRATMEPFVLEVNTIPGFTSHSLVPKSAARIGLGFDALCQRIIDLSFEARGR